MINMPASKDFIYKNHIFSMNIGSNQRDSTFPLTKPYHRNPFHLVPNLHTFPNSI